MAAVQIQVDNIANGPPEEAENRRKEIAHGVKRASDLIQKLLRLARLDETAVPPNDTIDIGPLLLDCVGEHVVLAEQKGVDLGVRIDEPTMCKGSSEELRLLFANLIDNAVRYTPTGGQVDVRLYRADQGIYVDVLDTGCGLPKDAEVRIFERFFRAAPLGVDGTGLGLAIARRVAERNGFELSVENRSDGRTGVLARVVLDS